MNTGSVLILYLDERRGVQGNTQHEVEGDPEGPARGNSQDLQYQADTDVAVELIASAETVLAAILTCSQTNIGSHLH